MRPLSFYIELFILECQGLLLLRRLLFHKCEFSQYSIDIPFVSTFPAFILFRSPAPSVAASAGEPHQQEGGGGKKKKKKGKKGGAGGGSQDPTGGQEEPIPGPSTEYVY